MIAKLSRLVVNAALAALLVSFALPSIGQQQHSAQRADPAAKVASVLGPMFTASEPGGAIIITDKGRVVFRKAYGMADLDRKIALKPEMMFRIGSMTKQFTAVAVLLLEQDGKLSLQDD